MSMTKEYREEITNKVIEALKNGTAPWQRTWVGGGPCNAVTGYKYQGINSLILSVAGERFNHGIDPRWATFLQAQSKGWRIKYGSKPVRILFWKAIKRRKSENTEDEETIGMLKYFYVFHASQINGISAYKPKTRKKVDILESNQKVERILSTCGAKIVHGGYEAFYSPSRDTIHVPYGYDFVDAEAYYSTLLHELAHWTAHYSRLNMDLSGRKGSISYAREELVAEIASMFLSIEMGVTMTEEHFNNHASYVGSWIGRWL